MARWERGSTTGQLPRPHPAASPRTSSPRNTQAVLHTLVRACDLGRAHGQGMGFRPVCVMGVIPAAPQPSVPGDVTCPSATPRPPESPAVGWKVRHPGGLIRDWGWALDPAVAPVPWGLQPLLSTSLAEWSTPATSCRPATRAHGS